MVRKQVLILTVVGWLHVVPVIAAEQFTKGPTARMLVQAAADLAGGRPALARAGFDTVIRDKGAPAFARSLSLLGMAQAAEAGNDWAGGEEVARRDIARARHSRGDSRRGVLGSGDAPPGG